MKKSADSNQPDASYINGVAVGSSGSAHISSKKAPTETVKKESEKADRTKEVRAGDERSEVSPSREVQSGKRRRRLSHSKRSNIKKVLKAVAPTAALMAVVLILVIITVIQNRGKQQSAVAEPSETYVIPATEEDVKDMVDLTEEEAAQRAVMPSGDVFGDDGEPLVIIHRENDEITGFTQYNYKEDGTPTYEKDYNAGGYFLRKTVFWAEDENCVKSVVKSLYNSNEDFSGYVVDQYSADDFLMKETEYAKNGAKTNVTTYEYDEEGRLEFERSYAGIHENRMTGYFKHVYNSAGLESEIVQYDAGDNVASRVLKEYDETGRLTKKQNYQKNILKSWDEYFYREDGSCVRTLHTLVSQATMEYKDTIFDPWVEPIN